MLLEQRANGTAILLLSEGLDELRSMADVILVSYEDRIVGEVSPDRFDPEQIGLMMAVARTQGTGRLLAASRAHEGHSSNPVPWGDHPSPRRAGGLPEHEEGFDGTVLHSQDAE